MPKVYHAHTNHSMKRRRVQKPPVSHRLRLPGFPVGDKYRSVSDAGTARKACSKHRYLPQMRIHRCPFPAHPKNVPLSYLHMLSSLLFDLSRDFFLAAQLVYQEWPLKRRTCLTPSGQSHLNNPIQNALEILIVPTGLETFGMEANTRRFFLAQQIE